MGMKVVGQLLVKRIYVQLLVAMNVTFIMLLLYVMRCEETVVNSNDNENIISSLNSSRILPLFFFFSSPYLLFTLYFFHIFVSVDFGPHQWYQSHPCMS